MDFDFDKVIAPFRMLPGLVRLDADAVHLTPLDPHSALYREKLSVSRAGWANHCVAGFDPGDALRAISTSARSAGHPAPGVPPAPLELRFQEDLAVLDGRSGSVPWMCVCVPSGWAPEDKLGKSLAAIHAPVAEASQLVGAMPHLARLVSGGARWERHVWTIGASPLFDQHPSRHPPAQWPDSTDPAEFARQCYFRAERQTFLPVSGRDGQPKAEAVFTIRVMVEPLERVVNTPEKAQRLHAALGSMGAGVLDYKHLAAARESLLHWLAQTATGAGKQDRV